MEKKFNILVIAPTPFFADRGCHIRILEEIRALQKLGNKVTLYTYGLGRDMLFQLLKTFPRGLFYLQHILMWGKVAYLHQ
ncbi:unnamed protein product [marine sediment metagenome]|uniref:Glycosyltransferase subfamily 4-like N-terminal domain-containing protein n=1 Tax=marine sediment metagenome TaxID=412755 RepID=X1GC07_9ZZZZ